MGDFTELRVWQKSKDLAVYIYQVTDKGRFVKDFGLRDQIRRAAVSIPSNIPEGEDLVRTSKVYDIFIFQKDPLLKPFLNQ